MNAKDINHADADREEIIRNEEEELGLLLSRVMDRPLEPLSARLASMEKHVLDVDEAVRTVTERTLGDLAGQLMDVGDGLHKLKSAGERQSEELGTWLADRIAEIRKDMTAFCDGHERIKAELTMALETGQRRTSDEIAALSAQAVSAATEKQTADAHLVAAVAMLRAGMDQQNDTLKQSMATLAQQLQTQHQAGLDALALGLAGINKRTAVLQRRVQWFGIVAAVCGLVTMTLVLLHS